MVKLNPNKCSIITYTEGSKHCDNHYESCSLLIDSTTHKAAVKLLTNILDNESIAKKYEKIKRELNNFSTKMREQDDEEYYLNRIFYIVNGQDTK